MKAVVLAAGKGERLWPLTETRPKPLLPIANEPILKRTLQGLVGSGVHEIILVVNYMEKMVRDTLGSGASLGCEIDYVKQNVARGTADAVRSASEKLRGEDRFLVVYGDDHYDPAAVKEFVAKAQKNDGISMATSQAEDTAPFGRVDVKSGRVTEISEKTAKPGPGLVNAGLYMMSQSILPPIRRTTRSKRGEFELTDSLRMMIHQGEAIRSEELGPSGWLGISYPWDLLEANELVLGSQEHRLDGELEDGVQIKGAVIVEKGSLVKAGSRLEGPVRVARGCQIGPNAYLRAHTCLGEDVKVGAGCEVKNSIVMARSKVPHLSYVGDSVIGEACSLGAGTITANLRFDEAMVKSRVKGLLVSSGRKKLGTILGDEVRTGINVSIFPGVKIGSKSWIGPSAIIQKDVPAGARVPAG